MKDRRPILVKTKKKSDPLDSVLRELGHRGPNVHGRSGQCVRGDDGGQRCDQYEDVVEGVAEGELEGLKHEILGRQQQEKSSAKVKVVAEQVQPQDAVKSRRPPSLLSKIQARMNTGGGKTVDKKKLEEGVAQVCLFV